MAEFRCGICGTLHDHLPMALAYQRPAHVFAVPAKERASRVQCNDDLCVIDEREFLIRGVLELPIKGTDKHFEWGVWALVARKDFVRYVDAWRNDTEEDVPPFVGRLSGGLRAYPGSDMLTVTLHLRPGGKRPLFEVSSREHELGIDQRDGITMDKAHGFVVS